MNRKMLYSEEHIATALLLLRIGIGISFMFHGFPKLFLGGAVFLGKELTALGIPGGVFGAYLAAMAEFFGGMALIAGVLFRPTALVLLFTMLVALTFHLRHGDNFITYSHAVESGVLFIALAIAGPGRFSVDRKLFGTEDNLPLPEECRPNVRQMPVGQAA